MPWLSNRGSLPRVTPLRLHLAAAALAWPICGEGFAQQDQPLERSVLSSVDLPQILATVDGVPIRRGEVRLELSSILSDRRPEAVDEPQLEREMLDQLIRRRLALAALVSAGRAAPEDQVERELAARRASLEQRGESLDNWLAQNGVDREGFRRRIHWELSWASYTASTLSEQYLREFFDRYRRHFDGTEVRVSHILLPDSALESARQIKASIESGSMTFAEAAGKHSTAPSRDRGGDIGYFPRRGVMHESFAAAAFRLEPGEVSPPVVTPHGVHLIQLTDERSGTKTFAEVQSEVRRAAEARLFERLVADGRERVGAQAGAEE